MAHCLLDKGNLDDAMIRRWAFDPEATLTEQDEDLELHDWTFAETLLELAADPTCPKADYILSIWNYFTRHSLVHRIPSDIHASRQAIALAEKYRDHSGIQRWVADQKVRHRYVDGVGHVNRATSLSMADSLLKDADHSCQIDVLRETDTHFLMQLSVPNYSHKEWLLIDKMTGEFRYSRYWPEKAIEPRWFEPCG